ALYAVASQNLPLMRIAMGTSDAFPFAGICSTASVRGLLSFLDLGLRSLGEIWGRSSWANDVIALAERQTSSTSTIALQPAVSRCKIFRNASRQETDRRA